MNRMMDVIGPAVWRASWQATLLAIIVVFLLRGFGDRLSPQWRFLLWGVVLARLLCIVTPGSPWSLFNLAHWSIDVAPTPVARIVEGTQSIQRPQNLHPKNALSSTGVDLPSVDAAANNNVVQANESALRPAVASANATGSAPYNIAALDVTFIIQSLSILWGIGCLLMLLQLTWNVSILRRRLSVCQRVTDPVTLNLLKIACRRMGLQRSPALLVSPSQHSPFVVGAWTPRIVVPEVILTDASAARLRHVLAHELAHLVRGDLYTNWLLIVARILHWFNPIAWWTVREMQAEREAACDELAFAALGDAERSGYASTIVELAAILSPATLAPGFIGLFSSTGRLNARIERLLRFPSTAVLRTPVVACMLIALAMIGLTDAMPGANAQLPKDTALAKDNTSQNNHTVSGQCLESVVRTPLAGITMKLFRLEGRTSPAVEIATTTSDAEGRYSFPGLVAPRRENHLDRLDYGVFGFANDRPIGPSFHHFDKNDKEVTQIWMGREKSTIAGKVIDSAGRPLAGATVLPYIIMDQPVPSLHSATTDADGRFKLDGIGVIKWPHGEQVRCNFKVRHPDYPEVMGEAKTLPADVVVTLPPACMVSGTVFDSVTGQPAVGAVITARRTDEWKQTYFSTDAQGRFRFAVLEGRYDFIVDANERVCVATTGRDCRAGEKVDLQEFKLIAGGFIAGYVVNTVTGEMVSVSEHKDTLMLGLFGPSQPPCTVISPQRMAAVDKSGRFQLRAAPGENFPYFVNTRGVRMAWDTQKQPPVIVHEGETTTYNMLITPEVPPKEKLAAARKLVEALSKNPSDRTAQILLEFRKLNHTVDECETWCILMRELVKIGSDAIPQLTAELDQTTELDLTTEGGMLRRLPFALRAIGDTRAVPALIRAIPKTLRSDSSDYGLMVDDKDLLEFMQLHDLDKDKREKHFGLGRPVREVFGALHKLTGQDFNDRELSMLSLSQDPRRQILQRRIFVQHAKRWQEWWQANWQSLTKDAAFKNVDLKFVEEPMPPAVQALGKTAKLVGVSQGEVLSPAIQGGEYATHFYDLDSGYEPIWPAEVPKDETVSESKPLADWVQKKGVDLMCVTHRSPDGKETYVLRAFGMKVREIQSRELRDLERLISAGQLPEGRPVGELLMHFDTGSQQYVPEANAGFIFTTSEGNMGLIEITDRITRTANMTGLASGASSGGVGFHKGVQFNLKEIVP